MFLLRKWYMDCTTADGLAVIAYHATVRWGAIRMSYASLLRCPPDDSPAAASTTLRPGGEPSGEPGLIRWMCPRLGLDASWSGCCGAFERRLIDGDAGMLNWRCAMPRADCVMDIEGFGEVRGLGYVESLEMTLAPWNLPIRELRWGRWASEGASLVWIEWRGPRPLTLILEEGCEVPGLIGDEAIELAGGRRLALRAARTIREGELGATVLAGIPKLRDVLPPAILRTSERKWLSRGVLEPSGATGWAIHERVVFGGS